MGKQSEVIKVTETSSLQWGRVSMIRGMSLLHGSLRVFVKRQGKERRRKILRFLTQFEEGSTNIVCGTCLLVS